MENATDLSIKLTNWAAVDTGPYSAVVALDAV